jgi:hypothetical protein
MWAMQHILEVQQLEQLHLQRSLLVCGDRRSILCETGLLRLPQQHPCDTTHEQIQKVFHLKREVISGPSCPPVMRHSKAAFKTAHKR